MENRLTGSFANVFSSVEINEDFQRLIKRCDKEVKVERYQEALYILGELLRVVKDAALLHIYGSGIFSILEVENMRSIVQKRADKIMYAMEVEDDER